MINEQQERNIDVDELSLVDIIQVIMKHKWIVLCCTVISVLIAIVYIIGVKPVYESKAIIRIGHIGNITENQVAMVYIEEPDSLSKELTTISNALSVKPENDNKKNSLNIMTLKVQKNDPDQARESLTKITNDLIKRHDLMFQQVVVSREQQLDSLRKRLAIVKTSFDIKAKGLSNQAKLQVIEIQSDLEKQIGGLELLLSDIYLKPTKLLQEPTLNTQPVKPDKPRTFAIALILGAMIGVMLTFLVEYFQKYFPVDSLKNMPASK